MLRGEATTAHTLLRTRSGPWRRSARPPPSGGGPPSPASTATLRQLHLQASPLDTRTSMPTPVRSSSDDGCQASPLTEPFPWSRLPPELRVEVLTYLRRRDLAQCRLLNHEMLEMISASEGSMRRRQLDLVRIERIGNGRVQLAMRCDEEGKSRKWVAYQRRKRRRGADVATHMKKAFVEGLLPATTLLIGATAPAGHASSATEPTTTQIPPATTARLIDVTRGSDIDRLRINEMKLSDSALSSLSSSLLSVECRVRLLSFELTSLTKVTPSALLRFVSDVSPSDVVFRMIRGCTPEHFGPQMCRFLSSRHYFSVSELVDDHAEDVPLSMDDAILGQLTSSVFHIGCPNYITSDGLRSFIRRVSSGNLDVVAGRIHTGFAVDEATLPQAADGVRLIEDQRIIDISTQSREMLPPLAMTAHTELSCS